MHPDDVVVRAVDLMLATDQGRIPVTDPRTGRLVGLLTRKDLLQVRACVARSERERQAFFRGFRRHGPLSPTREPAPARVQAAP